MSHFIESVVSTASEYFGEVNEIVSITLTGFMPIFFVLILLMYLFTKIVRGKMNKYHWIGIAILSAILSSYVSFLLTFAG